MAGNNNRSSLTGILLIGLVLILFSWYQTRKAGKYNEEQMRIRDSLANVAALADTLSELPPAAQVDGAAEDGAPVYANESLAAAASAEESLHTLENELLRITFTSRGAQPGEVLVKNYYKHDSTDLLLVSDGGSVLDLEFNAADQYISASEFNWQLHSSSDTSLVFRLPFSEESAIEATYTLPDGKYMVDYDLRFIGMDKVFARGASQLALNWALDMPRLEKGYKNERNYSAVAYRNGGADGNVKTIGQRKESVHETFPTRLRWVGFQQQFFSAILLAKNEFSSGELYNKFYPDTDSNGRLMHSWAKLSLDLESRNPDFTVPMAFYFGPNHFPTLKKYDEKFEKIIPLGGKIVGSISRFVIIPIFNWLSKSISSYGLIILILTLIIKIVIFPLTYRSYASSAKMQILKPEIDRINARYPRQEDAMKKSQATMELYKKAGVSPLGGCLPILLQFPVLWAMFRFFPASIELRQQPFLWAEDLSTYDSILNFGFNLPLYGDHVSLFALLMGISMWGYSQMTMRSTDTSSMPGMKFMQVWMMPIMMVFLCNNFSSGLSYYYLLSNIITILQSFFIKRTIDADKLYERIRLASAKDAKPRKSKFQQRLDEMYKAQQQQMKQKNNR